MDERLDAVKALLGITGDESDAQLQTVILTVEARVLSYINHEKLPRPLEQIVLVLCAEYYKKDVLGTSGTEADVASISRGDVSISYADKTKVSVGASSLSESGDGFFGWRSYLQEYRKLRR